MNRSARAMAFAAVVVATLVAAACTGPAGDRPLQVVGVWTGREAVDFQKRILDPGPVRAHYVGSRDLGQLLASDYEQGTVPDVVVMASPADLRAQLARLQPLTDVTLEDYPPAWRALAGISKSSRQYAVILKADLKGLVWYDPETLRGALKPDSGGLIRPTWAELRAATASGHPWCLGLGANAASGFPGADWIAEIMLQTYGRATYERWVRRDLYWNSPQLQRAFTIWAGILRGVAGGPAGALLTNFDEAGLPMFARPPGCRFDNEGSFITSHYTTDSHKPRPSTDFNFFPFPAIASGPRPGHQVGANVAGLLKNTDDGQKLMGYLAGQDSQALWPRIGSYSVSPAITDYDNPVAGRVADILSRRSETHSSLCFGAADLMSGPMRTAFYQAVLAFAANPVSGPDLETLLNQLDAVPGAVYSGPICSR